MESLKKTLKDYLNVNLPKEKLPQGKPRKKGGLCPQENLQK
jgi:hypothetical protein